MARGRKNGIDNEKPVTVCMVVGCTRKALYRNAGSVASHNTQRGYCSERRHMAVPRLSASTLEAMARYLMFRVDKEGE